jgi:hypothetical protein
MAILTYFGTKEVPGTRAAGSEKIIICDDRAHEENLSALSCGMLSRSARLGSPCMQDLSLFACAVVLSFSSLQTCTHTSAATQVLHHMHAAGRSMRAHRTQSHTYSTVGESGYSSHRRDLRLHQI